MAPVGGIQGSHSSTVQKFANKAWTTVYSMDEGIRWPGLARYTDDVAIISYGSTTDYVQRVQSYQYTTGWEETHSMDNPYDRLVICQLRFYTLKKKTCPF